MIRTETNPDSVAAVLRDLWRQASLRCRRQFFLILALTLLGAIAEVMTLGTLLPFLAFIANPEAASHYPIVERSMSALGLSDLGNHLLALTLLFSAAAILAGAIRILIAWASNHFVFTFGHELSVGVYERVLYQPYSYHVGRNTSTVIAALQQVQAVTGGVVMPILQSIGAAIIGLFIVAALIAFNPMIAVLTFAGFGAIYVAVSLFVRKRLSSNARTIAKIQMEAIRAVQEGLGGIRDVLIDGTQPAFLARFSELNRDLWKAQRTNSLAAVTPRFAIEAAGMVLIAGLACLLVTRTSNVAYVLPILGVFALGAQRLLPLMQLFYGNWALIVGNLAGARVVLTLLEAPVGDDRPGSTSVEPLPFRRAIVFKDVTFRYGLGQRPVLRHFDLTIAKGSRIALVGKTGAGKSTAVDILMGLLEPTSGSIEIDGQRLDATTRRPWQRQIAHVPQSIFLADTSIALNIAFGVEPGKIDHDRVRRAAERASLGSFIETLPHGYDTVVGERGINLSGGQRQRIGIARAFYKQATVLVLDEATNALDTETEASILDAIVDLDKLTVVIIAHRLTSKDLCDRVVKLEGGKAEIPTDAPDAVRGKETAR